VYISVMISVAGQYSESHVPPPTIQTRLAMLRCTVQTNLMSVIVTLLHTLGTIVIKLINK